MKSCSRSLNALVAIALGFSLCTPSMAQKANAAAQACRPDFTKFCPGVKPGGGRIVECLKQHEAELSPACQAAMGPIDACGPQIKQICGAAAPGPALRECMKTHASEFSASCRAAVSAASAASR